MPHWLKSSRLSTHSGRSFFRRLFFASAYCGSTCFATVTLAQSFPMIQPATCPSFTEIPFTYRIGGGSGTWEQPRDMNDNSVYIDNINYYRTIIGNSYTSQFGVRIDAFSTEQSFDFLTLSSGNVQSLSGTPSTGWYDMIAPSGEEIDQFPPRIQFTTDYSVGSSGFSIGMARVCYDGAAGSTGTAQLKPFERHSGVLLGTGDTVTVYATMPASNVHTTFALWGGSTGTDFDIYARCGQPPTSSQYTVAATSNDNQEFLHVDSTLCAAGTALFIAVHSFSGSGSFHLVEHQHYSSEHYGTGRADTINSCSGHPCPIPGTTKTDVFKQVMGEGFKRYFGATEGSQFWAGGLVLNNTGGGYQPIKFSGGSGRASTNAVCGSSINLFWSDPAIGGGPDNGKTLMHELGHMRGCVGDEYNLVNNAAACGHSIMAVPYDTVTNFCYCSDWQKGQAYNQNECHLGFGDHSLDRKDGQGPDTNNGPAWTNLQNRIPIPITTTPDAYDYSDFDFNGLYDVTLQ